MELVQRIVNEDGTDFNPPENPLMRKWLRDHPPSKISQYSQICDGYSCMWCGRCPHGDYWKVPDEDRKEYDAYLDEYHNYMVRHNPSLLSCRIRSDNAESLH